MAALNYFADPVLSLRAKPGFNVIAFLKGEWHHRLREKNPGEESSIDRGAREVYTVLDEDSEHSL